MPLSAHSWDDEERPAGRPSSASSACRLPRSPCRQPAAGRSILALVYRRYAKRRPGVGRLDRSPPWFSQLVTLVVLVFLHVVVSLVLVLVVAVVVVVVVVVAVVLL